MVQAFPSCYRVSDWHFLGFTRKFGASCDDHWQEPTGASFAVDTVTQAVNAHRALVRLKQPVRIGHRLKLKNVKTSYEIACVVVNAREPQERKLGVGIEFDQPPRAFSRISFSPDDWNSRNPFTSGTRSATK